MNLRFFLSLTVLTCLWASVATLPADAQSRKRGKKTEQRVKKKSRTNSRVQRTTRTTRNERATRKRSRDRRTEVAERPTTNRRERRRDVQPETTPAVAPTAVRNEPKPERKSAVADKRVGWDDKGRPLYEESGGKRYYVNASGSKVYAAEKN